MIGILQNKHLTENKLIQIKNNHLKWFKILLDKEKKNSGKKYGKTNIEEDINNLEKALSNAIKVNNFEDLVIADFDKLCKLKRKIDNNNFKNSNINFVFLEKLFNTLYAKYRKTYAKKLVENLEITVCPYCNRNFINNTQKYAMAQFDHFFPKSKYPMFALSLYNLIPCCQQCNHNKLEKELSYSPYNKSLTTDKLLQFTITPILADDFEIEIQAKNKIIEKNIAILLLKDAYAIHKPLVNELNLKAKMYTDCYIRSLNNLVKNSKINIDMTSDELWYGNYLTEDKYYLRPLSKLTHDIVEIFRNSKH